MSNNESFINQFAGYVKKYAPLFGICVYSPIIAQGILESASGTSNKVYFNGEWRHNYLGLKWRNGRCAVSNEYFEEWTSEQNPDGTYKNIVSRFCKFKSMEDCVLGYFQWTNIPNYANLKGVTDPRTYLENIKADRYATSLKYVDNVMAVIEKYDLTRFDDIAADNADENNKEEVTGMKILLSVGHSRLKSGAYTSADGRPYGGTLEYTYNKGIVNKVAEYLRTVGYKVDVLICPELQFSKSSEEKNYKIPKEKAGNYDFVAELHLNASKFHNARGCEVLYASNKGKEFAEQIQKELATVFKDRGVQKRTNLYMLTQTKAPAVIIESFFCDNSADCALAEKTDVALLIAQGIYGKKINVSNVNSENADINDGVLYCVHAGVFKIKANAEALVAKLKAAGFDALISEE